MAVTSVLVNVAYTATVLVPHAEYIPQHLQLPKALRKRGVTLYAYAVKREQLLVTVTAPATVRLQRVEFRRWLENSVEEILASRRDECTT